MDIQFSFLYQTFLGLFLAALFSYGIHTLLARWAGDNRSSSPGVIAGALRMPMIILPWVLLLLFIAHGWLNHDNPGSHDNLKLVENILLILFPGWILWSISSQSETLLKTLGSQWSSRISGSVIARSFQLLVVFISLGSVAQMLGYSFSALLAFGGVGGIVLGFAAKEWLANFFGGLMLMLDRPFAEGDWVRSPDRNIEGHVEAIGWRLTRIRTFDRRPIYVPNALFTGIVVENPSRMRNRRMIENFGLRYEDIERLPFILNRVLEQVKENPDIDCDEPMYACFIRYDDSALLCQIRFHIKRTDRVGFLQVQQWVLLMVANIVAEQGAEFAYPTRRLISDDISEK